MKKLLSIILTLAILCSLTACSGTSFGSLEYVDAEFTDLPAQGVIAENANYTLELDHLNMGIVLTDKKTGNVWKSTPEDPEGPQVDELGMPIKKHPRVESILAVECKNFVRDEVNTYYSYTDAVQLGKVTHTLTESGIILNFYFSEAGVMIPLECTLTEKGVRLSVDPKKILESDNKVTSLSIAPFFCGVKNDTEDSYLFVPSGSGAVVGVNTKSEQGDSYSAQLYGHDLAIDEIASVSTTQPIRLNVYGAKTGDNAVCAIIDGSDASAKLNVSSGSKTFGYSSVYPTFIMRGYTNHIAELFSYEKIERVVYAKKMIAKPVSVTFYPLSGEDANYSGMAETYRNYLIENYGLKEKSDDTPLNIRVFGGTLMDKSFLGIPYQTVYPATTIKDATSIIDELDSKLKGGFTVQLKGFGESGADVGKIAGDYSISSKLGSMKELQELYSNLQKKNIGLYFDFDIERFDQNSTGVSKFFDSATNAGELKAIQYYYDVAVRDKKTDTAYYLLSPSLFGEVFDRISKKTGKYNISGISLDSLSAFAYSDYTDKENSQYYSKNGFADAAADVIKKLKEENKSFMATAANSYSAAYADIITETPVSSEKSHIFLYDVPFYQMVFKGSLPITVESVNLSADPRMTVLKAVESGSGLGYTVTNGWDNSVINADIPYFYNSVFSDVKKDIFSTVEELSGYYSKISGQHIVGHSLLQNGLRETVFENGVTVYVNFTDKTLTSPAGEVASMDYLVTEK